MAIRVILADQDQLFRSSAAALLNLHGFAVVAEARDGRQVVSLSRALRPDLALLEVFLPSLNGHDAAREILEASGGTKVVLFTSYLNGPYITNVIHDGIRGYISKNCKPEVLLDGLKEVGHGALYMCPDAVWAVMEQDNSSSNEAGVPLTLKEREVLQLIAEGKTAKEVAAILGISTKTAAARRQRIAAKLKEKNIAHLVRYAVRHGLIPT